MLGHEVPAAARASRWSGRSGRSPWRSSCRVGLSPTGCLGSPRCPLGTSDPRAGGRPDRLSRWLATELGATGDVSVARLGEGHSNLTYAVSVADGRELGAAPPAGRAAAADRARRGARVPRPGPAGRAPSVPVRVPRAGRGVQRRRRARGAVLPDGARRGRRRPRRTCRPGWTPPRRHVLGLDLAAAFAELHRVDPQPFVAAGLGRAGRLPCPAAAPVGRPARGHRQAAVAAAGGTGPCAARLRRGPRLAGRPPARRGAAGRRPRRRQARQRRGVGPPGTPARLASPPSSTGRWPPSATRAPISATCCRSGPRTAPPPARTRWPGW